MKWIAGVATIYGLGFLGLIAGGWLAEQKHRCDQLRRDQDAGHDEVWAAFERARAHAAPVPPTDDPAQEGTP